MPGLVSVTISVRIPNPLAPLEVTLSYHRMVDRAPEFPLSSPLIEVYSQIEGAVIDVRHEEYWEGAPPNHEGVLRIH